MNSLPSTVNRHPNEYLSLYNCESNLRLRQRSWQRNHNYKTKGIFNSQWKCNEIINSSLFEFVDNKLFSGQSENFPSFISPTKMIIDIRIVPNKIGPSRVSHRVSWLWSILIDLRGVTTWKPIIIIHSTFERKFVEFSM